MINSKFEMIIERTKMTFTHNGIAIVTNVQYAVKNAFVMKMFLNSIFVTTSDGNFFKGIPTTELSLCHLQSKMAMHEWPP